MQLATGLPGPHRALLERKTTGSALLVDPDPFALANRTRLLMRACETVHAVTRPREVYELQPAEEPFVAVLTVSLGAFDLQAVAEYVRHRWPHTRILIVGETSPSLEDQLYDESIPLPVSGGELLLAVERCRGLRL